MLCQPSVFVRVAQTMSPLGAATRWLQAPDIICTWERLQCAAGESLKMHQRALVPWWEGVTIQGGWMGAPSLWETLGSRIRLVGFLQIKAAPSLQVSEMPSLGQPTQKEEIER